MPAQIKGNLFQSMDTSTAPSGGSMGVTGLLRDSWTGISEALAPSPTGIASANFAMAAPTTANAMKSTELLELTSRLTRQLKRAEDTCRRIETREKARVEVLRRCLAACCAKESAEVLELALEISANEEPDVERDSREFRELLILRTTPDEKIEMEMDRVAQLERELKEEKAARLQAEQEKAVVLARLQTQQEAWEKERERYFIERKTVEETVKERLQVESQSFNARLKSIEQTNRDRLELETNKLLDKIRVLESKLEKEMQINKQRKDIEERLKKDELRAATTEKDVELEHLRLRVRELEDESRSERSLMELAKAQATKERVVTSLEHRVRELESRCTERERELNELRAQKEGAVPPEYLGPARGDYLRHVLLRYLTFDTVSQKQTLIPVIAMLLDLSPEEKKLCEQAAARDLAKEGLIGTLTSTFQAMPIHTIFTPSSSNGATRPVQSSARYIPVSTSQLANGDNE